MSGTFYFLIFFTMNKPSRGVAILLALFFGWIGIPRFYMNKPFSGMLYLLFFWTTIPLWISIIEVFYYLCLSQTAFEKECGGIKNEPKSTGISWVEELEKWHKLYKEKAITKELWEEKKALLLLWKQDNNTNDSRKKILVIAFVIIILAISLPSGIKSYSNYVKQWQEVAKQ